MRTKRFLAVVLSAAMVVGNSAIAFASSTATSSPATATLSGIGRLEGPVSSNVFKVELPTVPEGPSGLDFILDPQELIKATKGERYLSSNAKNGTGISVNSKSDITDSSLYFATSVNGAVKLGPESGEMKIVNKSTRAVTASINAHFSAVPSDITVSSDKTFEGNTQPSFYLALKADGNETSISETNAVVGTKVLDSAASYYTKEYVSANDSYVYTLTSANEAANESKFDKYTFSLTGTSNTKADWAEVTPIAVGATSLKVDLVFNISEKQPAAPSIQGGNEYVMTSGKGVPVQFDLGFGTLAATNITSVTFNNGSSVLPTDKYKFDAATGKLVFTSALVDTLMASSTFTEREYTITFNDTAKTQLTVTLKK